MRAVDDVATVLLAVHAKVLGAVGGERTVLTGYRAPGTAPSAPAAPWPVEIPHGSWRDLLAAAEAAAGSRYDRDGERAKGETPALGVVLDLTAVDDATGPGNEGEHPDAGTTVLDVAYTADAGGLLLRLRYQRQEYDADHAARFAGYHLRALELLAADPDAPHNAATLLGEEELHRHLHGHAGEEIPLPGKLFAELFEERVRQHPDARAASHHDRHWTYRELNERANRVAHALLRHGVEPEAPVAVAMDRELDWIAALLGVVKAGGAYLPLRPDFPPERIAAQLTRAECRFVLTKGEGASARAATGGLAHPCSLLRFEDTQDDAHSDADPQVPIAPDALAYIYFTSGSTGEPKGAMCEHAGMLNHLYMKIEDMGLGEGDVVTQTASQCFDISLWQAIAPLLVGGSTRIVDTDAQLDVGRFVGHIADGGIHAIQVVPAYLEVMITYLAGDPRPLGDLRIVSVTGEALKLEVVRRWFALYPDIKLVNAYGATEVSDDTMHEVLSGLPERDFVSVGRSLRNVRTYVLDETLRVAPLGAPGEIAFSGVCVGRGYINDEERTAQAFVEDPYRPGVRMYRTGDFGRWLPEGTIEFLGRRDEQVKIRGFRIEIGEIENKLLSMPEVREAAVVIEGAGERDKNLVAFYNGEESLRPEEITGYLGTLLPDYMIPTYFHRLDPLPLTENGKVNKRMLTRLAGTLGHGGGAYAAPVTATERRLATGWAEALGVPLERIGRRDNFFELGGTSLAAVRLVVGLNRLVSLKQVVTHPVLGDLAALVDAPAGPGDTLGGGLLQRLSPPDTDAVATLVAVPYAGGNAVNFRQLAEALAPRRIAVYAVELPGHDLGDTVTEDFLEVTEVAKAVHHEIATTIRGPVMLWGHCAGTAHVLELARLLEASGHAPLRVFAAALLLDDADALWAESAEVGRLSDQEITALLRRDSAYVELDFLKPERAEVLGAAYRHDVISTNRYLVDAAEQPGEPLATPVEAVFAADDPTTAGYAQRFTAWKRLAARVSLRELGDGGHYFIRTRAGQAADIVAAAVPEASAADTGKDG
ncbi:amino acid adenylation domain-containing protein [Streptomyces sp. NPDC007100]|uniref:non-ribosomal peptide synthetase n=1 Tax=Streptomyces sp. NPDC007100 TaxID=3155602 RepID=UPI0033EF17E6